MINTLKHGALLVTAIFMVATPAHSQAPTDAQRNAIRSACRADYQAHCASVPPGGEASLQCLQKNMSSLSSGCQGAVRAVEPAAAPKAETAPAAAAATPAARRSRAAPAAAPAATAAKPATAAPAAAPKAAASTTAKQADRCAGCRDPQRLPLRLSEGLRRRADRRRSGTAMPGEEQGEGFGALRAGRQRGQRRCRRRRRGAAPRRPRARERPLPLRPRRSSCCGRCGRAKNCSS